MSRLPELASEALSPEQAALLEAIASTRGADIALQGPFAVWMHSPGLGEAAQRLGARLRYHSSLPPRLSELVILACARHWRAAFEWHVHAPLARRAGVAAPVIEAVRLGREPAFAAADEAAVHAFALSLLRTSRVPDPVYQQAGGLLGDAALVELAGLVGYYTLVAFTLNAFEVDAPAPVDWGPD
jgi:4-carboxymuconolactone decarboxylase